MFGKLIKQIKTNKSLFLVAVSILALIILSAIIPAPFWRSFLIIIGGFFSLFVPGFFLTLAIFPETEKLKDLGKNELLGKSKLDWLERIILSIFLSIAVVALFLTVIKQLGAELTGARVFVIIFIVNLICIGFGYLFYNKKVFKKK